jgi:hypothetical protein
MAPHGEPATSLVESILGTQNDARMHPRYDKDTVIHS